MRNSAWNRWITYHVGETRGAEGFEKMNGAGRGKPDDDENKQEAVQFAWAMTQSMTVDPA